MKKIGEISLAPGGLFEFHMTGDWFSVSHYGKKVNIEDGALIERIDVKTGDRSLCVDGTLFGLEEGKLIKVPINVLKIRDQIRENRAAEHSRLMLRKIGDTFYPHGIIEFFMFNGDLFVIGIEDETTTITDDKIEKIGDDFCVQGRDIAGFKGKSLTIPVEIIEARDRVRKINEANKKLKPIGKIAGPESTIVFYLKDSGELVIRYNDKEIIAPELCSVYGRPAVDIRKFQLNHDYLQIPADVEKAFLKLQKELALADLHLVLVGASLLDGREYFKLSTEISDEKWEQVKWHFELFECTGEFSGWLTSEPGIVESILGLKHSGESDKALGTTV